MKVKDIQLCLDKLNPEAEFIIEYNDIEGSISICPDSIMLEPTGHVVLNGNTMKIIAHPTNLVSERIISIVVDNIRKGGILRNEIQNII